MNMDRSYMSVLFGLSDSYRESKKNSFYELFLYINKFIFISGTDFSGLRKIVTCVLSCVFYCS